MIEKLNPMGALKDVYNKATQAVSDAAKKVG